MGEPIAYISVRGEGLGRQAVLSSPRALRYVAMAMVSSWNYGNWRSGPPAAAFKNGLYCATVKFRDGHVIYREVYAQRYPRAFFFTAVDPRDIANGLGSGFFYKSPIVPLYGSLPVKLREFWRFLVSPIARGKRCFGPPVSVAQNVSMPPPSPNKTAFDFPASISGQPGGLEGLVFRRANSKSVTLRDKASLNYLAAVQLGRPIFVARGTRWRADVSSEAGVVSRSVIVERYPPQILFLPLRHMHVSKYQGWAEVCPLYGSLPAPLWTAFDKLYKHLHRGNGGRGAAFVGAALSPAPRAKASSQAVAGTTRQIIRLAFADSAGAVVTLRDSDSLEYLQNVQHFSKWGYQGKHHFKVYAAVFWIRRERMPRMTWVAVVKSPRELIFVPPNQSLRPNFVKRAQIRCPLYGPLPPALLAAYKKLLTHVSVQKNDGSSGGNKGNE